MKWLFHAPAVCVCGGGLRACVCACVCVCVYTVAGAEVVGGLRWLDGDSSGCTERNAELCVCLCVCVGVTILKARQYQWQYWWSKKGA